MRKLLLGAFAALALISCQKDDDTTSVSGPDDIAIISTISGKSTDVKIDINVVGTPDLLEITPEGYEVYEALIQEGENIVGSSVYYILPTGAMVFTTNWADGSPNEEIITYNHTGAPTTGG